MRIAIIRLSSMGDILLTSPIVLALHKSYPKASIDFYTKDTMRPIIEEHPGITKVYPWDCKAKHGLQDLLNQIENRHYDRIIDLQDNWRSRRLARQLSGKIHRVDKEGFRRRVLVVLGWNVLRKRHVIQRYYSCISDFCSTPLMEKIELPDTKSTQLTHLLSPEILTGDFIVWAIGAKHYTKRLPLSIVSKTIQSLEHNILLIGDASDCQNAQRILEHLPKEHKVFDLTGKTSFLESVELVKRARLTLTNDSLLMHVAAGTGKPLISFWGSTTPALGFKPLSKQAKLIAAPKRLACRPCHTAGRSSCPKGHFNCMMSIEPKTIVEAVDDALKAQ